jgi:hypothetical protein
MKTGCYAILLALLAVTLTSAQQAAPQSVVWTFAASGASRNCGDVVMPAIAKRVQYDHAQFFWHLGDYRSIYEIDEDFLELNGGVTREYYYSNAWHDFITSQLVPFGSVPVYLVKGNHEAIPPKSSEDYLREFGFWLAAPIVRTQQVRDKDFKLQTYYHWIQGHIDFFTLDNSTADQFDKGQIDWLEDQLERAASDRTIKTITVAMHMPLPDSVVANHSMNNSNPGTVSGRRVYGDLFDFRRKTHKRVYILTSHSNFYMDNIFDTPELRSLGDPLPGLIIGTAGGQRYRLPARPSGSKGEGITDVYGYVLATVYPSGEILFNFKHISELQARETAERRYSPAFIHECFIGNKTEYTPDRVAPAPTLSRSEAHGGWLLLGRTNPAGDQWDRRIPMPISPEFGPTLNIGDTVRLTTGAYVRGDSSSSTDHMVGPLLYWIPPGTPVRIKRIEPSEVNSGAKNLWVDVEPVQP